MRTCAPAAERADLAATPQAVRETLLGLRRAWRTRGIAPALWEVAEQVLAEALNNVVEHANDGQTGGTIRLCTTLTGGALRCEIRDDGAPIPGGRLPAGNLANHGKAVEDLPEGGFGWYMIRTLATGLGYKRQNAWNTLVFQVAVQADAKAGIAGTSRPRRQAPPPRPG